MAGTIIADFIRTDASRLSLNVGNTTFATINASGFFSNTGTQIIAANGTVATSALSGTIATSQLADSAVTRAKLGIPGAVLQVVQNFATTQYSTTSASFQPCTNINVTITPTSASSKILILHQGMVNSLVATNWCWATIYRNASVNLYAGGANDAAGGIYTNNSPDSHCPITFAYLDSPATTSAVTYTAYFKSGSGGNTVRYNADAWESYFIAMEIAG